MEERKIREYNGGHREEGLRRIRIWTKGTPVRRTVRRIWWTVVAMVAGTMWSTGGTGNMGVAQEILPVGSALPALVENHFPSRLHQFIFTNWSLVPVERLALVLGASPDQIRSVAVSMGLPESPVVPEEIASRGYITVLRRNWHILPYDQILTLLDLTAEQLAFSLREDDFLYVKLGSLKPSCERLTWEEPTPEQNAIAAQIAAWIEQDFGDRVREPIEEPRFDFVNQLRRTTRPIGEIQAEIAARPSGMNSPGFLYSYVATFGDPLSDPDSLENLCPDGYLEQLAQVGVNGIWFHVVLRQLVPGENGPFADSSMFGDGANVRLENLRKLVARTQRYGIRLYLYMNEPRAMPLSFYEKHPDIRGVTEGDFAAMCTSDPQRKTLRWLEDSLAYLFAEVPGLGGIFTITGSENLTFCASHGGWRNCGRCREHPEEELIAQVNAAMERGVHRSAPEAMVIVWDWGWKGHGLSPEIIERLPQGVRFMSVSEWALPVERGGVKTVVGEYSLSAVGPGPRATAQWKTAREHGLPTLAKLQLNCTWEIAAIPYLPVVNLVAEHCERLSQMGVSGMMLGWSLGGYPSPNLEVAYEFAKTPRASADDVLDRVAVHRYGTTAATMAREAWTKMSSAFLEYPYGGGLYFTPTQMGPANRFYPEPTGFSATMVGIPYDSVQTWCGPYPPEIFATQFERMAAEWEEGVERLRDAVAATDDEHLALAESELRFAQTAGIHFASVARQIRFVLLRDRLARTGYPILRKLTPEERASLPEDVASDREALRKLIVPEIEAAKQLHAISSEDSRIGFEASNHYFYVPMDLVEKVISCRVLLNHLEEK
ncbi:MAG: hypothetical protein Q4C47_06420 [Planctomycetia bacterium]|nr:hypothetical protein [Planctomycetia bacterium]